MNSNTRIALTWGDCGENHAGNQQVGKIQETGTGVTMDDLKRFYHYYTEDVGGKVINIFISSSTLSSISFAAVCNL